MFIYFLSTLEFDHWSRIFYTKPPPQKTGPSKARNTFFFLPQSGYDFMSEPFD